MKPQSNSTSDCCSAEWATFKREKHRRGGCHEKPAKYVGVCVGEQFYSASKVMRCYIRFYSGDLGHSVNIYEWMSSIAPLQFLKKKIFNYGRLKQKHLCTFLSYKVKSQNNFILVEILPLFVHFCSPTNISVHPAAMTQFPLGMQWCLPPSKHMRKMIKGVGSVKGPRVLRASTLQWPCQPSYKGRPKEVEVMFCTRQQKREEDKVLEKRGVS